ncbi:hypothetical protein EGX98_04730 [Fusobacterium necrophorum]|uniref:Uncharacterized protein n=1 Tax=Fusobacterium necrophorum BL TaxID=1441732 RepID=A0AB73BWZ7_9FUSO|nr:hypothetical protein [Fusobacterium necrophorum]AYZ73404.1 hypothetical protein EGX98_04730 [Fusobacterium necrophorum]AZW08599.1 hypothetical protein EO219_02695 [Fusobacterium necrophorum subsp. necrophorum]KDE63765.1 hypothetical protein FUSO3_04320 [Fusobacterium necrophorum BL]SDB44393.1 hypothetical protein SAMN02983009_02141 [Fusobacterium necrophorum]SQD09529.1 Uncharacterised protein [Fusobacterium necrophorum subsp. necrophorum]
MRWEDIKNSITSTMKRNMPNTNIYFEEIDNPVFPYFFIDLVDYKKEFNTTHREWKSIILDIRYHPEQHNKNARSEVIEALEKLDMAFEFQGNKVLHAKRVEENEIKEVRWLTLLDTDIAVIDKVGHYVFTLNLFDLYGKPYDYELMKDLELQFKD